MRSTNLKLPIINCTTNPSISNHAISNNHAFSNPSVFRHDDDPAANVVPVAVRVLHACVVDQAGAVADNGVLVDDHAVEHDIAANAEHGWTIGLCPDLVPCRV